MCAAPQEKQYNEAVVDTKAVTNKQDMTTLSWEGLSCTVNGGKKTILKEVSGRVNPGRLTAIMGPSGAGKSTMLNVLAGRMRSSKTVSVGGTIKANGVPVEPRKFRTQIAYVMQEDALFATQTPREAITFSARLRLPVSTSKSSITDLVEGMITSLGLEKCANTLIGDKMIPGISGGEKKRTAIGVELIGDPGILFLDEPTSGLDSYAAFQVVKILKSLAGNGRTVITTIHQPSSEVFEMFDDTMLLADGRIVYNDSVSGLVEHFASNGHKCPTNYNPADYVMFTMQKLEEDAIESMAHTWAKTVAVSAAAEDAETGGDTAVHTATTTQYGAAVMGAEGGPTPGFMTQFVMLAKREMQNVKRDKASMGARIGSTVFLNLITGCVFYQAANWGDVEPDVGDIVVKMNSHFGALTFTAIGGMFGLSQPTMLDFPRERPVFLREYATGTYRIAPYFFSKALVEIPLFIFQSSLIFLTTYWLVGFSASFVFLTLVTALLGMVSSSTAMVVGALSSNVEVAIQAAPMLFVPQLLFAGFFIPISEVPDFLSWAQYLCSLKYSLNIILLGEFHLGGLPHSWNPDVSEDHYYMALYGCLKDGLAANGACEDRDSPMYNEHALLPRTDVVPGDIGIYVGILVALLVGFRTIALMALKAKARNA